MPELPEVEVLARGLAPLIRGRKIQAVRVLRARVIRPATPAGFERSLLNATFRGLSRRGKYLLFRLTKNRKPFILVGHLGMTGRMYLLPARSPLPKHTAVGFALGRENFIFEDTRYFGRLTLDQTSVKALGPEPLSSEFTMEGFAGDLKRSAQPVKVKLLDQAVVAGVGNIYASEALFRAGISPRLAACRLDRKQIRRLHRAIRETLADAIKRGSTVPLRYSRRERLFYYGQSAAAGNFYAERLRVYDRAGQPCRKCGTAVERIVQAARSTFFCPDCQPASS